MRRQSLFWLLFLLAKVKSYSAQSDNSTCLGSPTNHTIDQSTQAACQISKPCGGHWRIATIIVSNSAGSYYQFAGYIDTASKSCSSVDEVYYLSPGKASSNLPCDIKYYQDRYFTDEAHLYVENSSQNGTTVAEILTQASTCLKSKKLGQGEGGIVYFLTDLNCTDLCTEDLKQTQSDFISTMLNLSYIVKIGGRNPDQGCLADIFRQCNSSTQCSIGIGSDFSNTSICVSHNSITTVDLAILIAVGIAILILLIVLFFYIRRRNKKKLLEKVKQNATRRGTHLEKQKSQIPLDPWEFQADELEIFVEKELGRGAFAVVFEGRLKGRRPLDEIIPAAQLMASRKNRVAVKRVPPHADLLARRDFLDEINFMKMLGFHAHVLGMIGCQTAVDLPLIVLEFCENGDLLSFLKKNQNSIAEDGANLRPKDLISIAWQISDGMCYLRSLELIHRDLAARNVLLTKDLSAKISDFGLCRQPAATESSSIYISRGGRLPVKWMAIESLRDFHFSFQTDVWSFGVVLWELFSLGEMPFSDVNPTAMLEVLSSGERLQQPPFVPDEMYKLMTDCWKESSEDRITIEAAREKLNDCLTSSSLYYGYLSLGSEESMRL